MKNQDITIYGSGKQTRSFQYIDNLIEGMVRMMNTEDDLLDWQPTIELDEELREIIACFENRI